jgi:hypothetical protein
MTMSDPETPAGQDDPTVFLLRFAELAKKTHEQAQRSASTASATNERTSALVQDMRSLLTRFEQTVAAIPEPVAPILPAPVMRRPGRRWWIGAASAAVGAFLAGTIVTAGALAGSTSLSGFALWRHAFGL